MASCRCNLMQAKRGRRVLSGAETQAGIQNDDRLIFTRRPLDPTRLDQQRAANLDRLEMPLPRFRPVFAAHFGRLDFAGTDRQSAAADSFQSSRNLFLDSPCQNYFLRAENTNDTDLGFDIEVRRGGLAKKCS